MVPLVETQILPLGEARTQPIFVLYDTHTPHKCVSENESLVIEIHTFY